MCDIKLSFNIEVSFFIEFAMAQSGIVKRTFTNCFQNSDDQRIGGCLIRPVKLPPEVLYLLDTPGCVNCRRAIFNLQRTHIDTIQKDECCETRLFQCGFLLTCLHRVRSVEPISLNHLLYCT